MKEFERDMNRYIVIKRSDISKVSAHHLVNLQRIMDQANFYRAINDKEPLQCVVVESDWPEYERVWAMIEARVTGQPESVVMGQRVHELAESALRLNDGCCDGSGCKPTEEELKSLRDGDYQPEELWGGKRPTCPKCAYQTLDHFNLDTGKVDQVVVSGTDIIDRFPGRENRLIRPDPIVVPFAAGDKVEWCESGRWYPGTVKAVSEDMVLITDQHGNDGEYRFGITPIVAQGTRKPFMRPSGHGPVAWFFAAVDDAREQGHENMMLPRGLGNMIAEHISQLESQLERAQRDKTPVKTVTLRTYPVKEGTCGHHEFSHRNAAVNECAAILAKHGIAVNFMERGGPNITHLADTLKMLGLYKDEAE